MSLGLVLELIVNGLTFGLNLSLLGVGVTLFFGLGHILNLAHGEFAIMCAMIALILMNFGVNSFLSIILAVVVTGMIGLVFERTVLALVYRERGETRILMGLFVTLGFSLVIHSYLVNTMPNAFFSIKVPLEAIVIGDLCIRPSSLISAIISTSMLLSLGIFLKRTYIGKAIRGVAQDEITASLCGINPSIIRSLVFILGVVMAGLAGILYGLTATVSTIIAPNFTMLALIVSVVGGVRSVYGTIASGIMLGLVHAFSSYFFGAFTSYVILFTVAILTILIRPEGILGAKG